MSHPDRKWHTALAAFVFCSMALLTADLAAAGVHLTASDGDNGDYFGSSATELEDINGDGRWEFLVGAPFDQTAGLDAGAVLLWFGNEELTVVADMVWEGSPPERFGHAVARIGDVNGDNRDDWAVGAPGSNVNGLASGRVYIFFGRTSPSASADVVIDGEFGGDEFGMSVSAAGDFDGDGYDDLIVGAPFSDLRAQNSGAAYVIYGSSSGPSNDLADATALTGQVAEDHFGYSVSDAGNFLGGNENSVAVGAPGSNIYGGLDAGALLVYEGTLAGATPDTTIDFAAGISSSSKAGSEFGFAVRAIDSWNGDSYVDLAVGAPRCSQVGLDAGRIEIFVGGNNPSSTAYRFVNGASGNDQFGYSLARIRDVSGTGADDLLVGAPYRGDTATDAGLAYIYEGGRSSYNSASSLIEVPVMPLQVGTAADDLFGYAVASAGDFDGDGQWDYAVGAPGGNNLSGSSGGYCRLIDSTEMVVPNALSRWDAARLQDGALDLGFELGIPAETIATLTLGRLAADGRTGLEILWDGPALTDGCPLGDCLVRSHRGYRFVDRTAPNEGVTYDLTIKTAGSAEFRITGLAGAAGRPTSSALELAEVWPNPANPMVSVRFRAAPGVPVSGRIVDVRGRTVRTLDAGAGTGTWQVLTWDGRSDGGSDAASGTYFVQLQAEGRTLAGRLVLAR